MTDPSTLDFAKLGLSRITPDPQFKSGKPIELIIPKAGIYDALRVKGQVLVLPEPVQFEAGATVVVRFNPVSGSLELLGVKPPEDPSVQFLRQFKSMLTDLLEPVPIGSDSAKEVFDQVFREIGSKVDVSSKSQSFEFKILFRDQPTIEIFFQEVLARLGEEGIASKGETVGNKKVAGVNVVELKDLLSKGGATNSLFEATEFIEKIKDFTVKLKPDLQPVNPRPVKKMPAEIFESLLKIDSGEIHGEQNRVALGLVKEFVRLVLEKTVPDNELTAKFEKLQLNLFSFLQNSQEVLDASDGSVISTTIVIYDLVTSILSAGKGKKVTADSSVNKNPGESFSNLQTDSKPEKTEQEYLEDLQLMLSSRIESQRKLGTSRNPDGTILFVFPYLKDESFGSIATDIHESILIDKDGNQSNGTVAKPEIKFEVKLPHIGLIKGDISLRDLKVQLFFHSPESYKFVSARMNLLKQKLGEAWGLETYFSAVQSLRTEKI